VFQDAPQPCRKANQLRCWPSTVRPCVSFCRARHLKKIVTDLRLHYPDDTPVALVYRATWPEEKSHQSTLGQLLSEIKSSEWNLTTMLLVGEALSTRLPADPVYMQRITRIFFG